MYLSQLRGQKGECMPSIDNFGDELSLKEFEAIFSDNGATPTPNETEPQQPSEEPKKEEVTPDNVTTTQAFARRLKEKTEEAIGSERERIAKSMGYESYTAMVKAQEDKTLRDNGFDPETAKPIIDQMVEARLNSDPRLKELEEYKAKQIEEFGKRELAEITKLTDGEITKLEQLPKDVISLWKTTGSLKAAYMQLHGEELITKARAQQSKGSTDHLRGPNGAPPGPVTTRPLNEQEKKAWKVMYPHITDEELSKKTMPVKN